MQYFKVLPQYDGYVTCRGKSLIGGELFTKYEVVHKGIPMIALTSVEISRSRVYSSFGARFEMKS